MRTYDKPRIPGYDKHHLDPPLGRYDPSYKIDDIIDVLNENSGGRVPRGQNYHTGSGGFQQSLDAHIDQLGYTRSQYNALPNETRLLTLRRYYASF